MVVLYLNNKRIVKFSFEVEFDTSKFPYPIDNDSSHNEYMMMYIMDSIKKNVIKMFDGKGNGGARFLNKVECYELICGD